MYIDVKWAFTNFTKYNMKAIHLSVKIVLKEIHNMANFALFFAGNTCYNLSCKEKQSYSELATVLDTKII